MGLQKNGAGVADLQSAAVGIGSLERMPGGSGELLRNFLGQHRLLAGNLIPGRSSPTFYGGGRKCSRVVYLICRREVDEMVINCAVVPSL
eukprot:925063-Pyramimonas_sp.AAC.2